MLQNYYEHFFLNALIHKSVQKPEAVCHQQGMKWSLIFLISISPGASCTASLDLKLSRCAYGRWPSWKIWAQRVQREPSSGWSPVGDDCLRKQSPLRYLPEVIQQSCLNPSAGISKDDQQLRVGSEIMGRRWRVSSEDEGTFYVIFFVIIYYHFLLSITVLTVLWASSVSNHVCLVDPKQSALTLQQLPITNVLFMHRN